MSISCLDTIIGLSRNLCPCFGDPGEEEFNVTVSDSGLYMDDYINLMLANSSDCSGTGPWKLMRSAFLLALENVQSDVMKAISKSHKSKTQGYNAYVGKSYIQAPSAAHDVKGIRIEGKGIQGSYITFNKVKFASQGAGTFDVMLLDAVGTELFIQSITVTGSTAWQQETALTDWKVPLWIEGDEAPVYYLVTNNPNAAENEKPCKCGAKTGRHWSDVCTMNGVYSDGLTEDSFITKDTAGGLMAEITTSCEVAHELCNLVGDNKNMLARAILYRALAGLAEMILSRNISGFASTVSADVLQQKLTQYTALFHESITDIIENLQPGNCYTCNQGGITRRNLLS